MLEGEFGTFGGSEASSDKQNLKIPPTSLGRPPTSDHAILRPTPGPCSGSSLSEIVRVDQRSRATKVTLEPDQTVPMGVQFGQLWFGIWVDFLMGVDQPLSCVCVVRSMRPRVVMKPLHVGDVILSSFPDRGKSEGVTEFNQILHSTRADHA